MKFDAFAEEVLGKDAWDILKKSVAKEVRPMLAPRIVLGWLRQAGDTELLAVPGTDMQIPLAKTEMSDEPAFFIKCAATICAKFDCQPGLVKMSNAAGARLGKAIDDLIRRRKKVVGASELEKVDEPGMMAAPWSPNEPDAPAPQKKKQGVGATKPVQPPKLTRTETVTYRQLQQPCWRCSYPQLVSGELRGCLCTARMLKTEPVYFGARGPDMVIVGADSVITEILSTLG